MHLGIGLGITRLSGVLAAAPAFSPLDLFGSGEEGAWYDPSDLSTVWQDAAGTTPATAGDPVGRIDDKSGNGNHATQSTSTKRPTLQTSGGLYYLDFDGVDDAMATASIDFTATDQMSLFAGVYREADTQDLIAELSPNWNTNTGSFLFWSGITTSGTGAGFGSASRGSVGATGGHFGYTQATFTPPVTAVVTATHDIPGDLTALRGDGVAGTDGTGDKGSGNFGNYPIYIGARGGGTTFPLDGRVYGLIVRGAASIAAEISGAESYLAAKSGVTL
jgi:hypothetical protein